MTHHPDRRQPAHGLARFFDYRTLVAVAALVVVGVVAYTIVSANRRADRAVDGRDADRTSAAAQIAALTAQIRDLTTAAGDHGETIAELEAQIAALTAQIRQMGGEPIVIVATPATRRDRRRGDGQASPPPPPPPGPTATASPTRPTPTPTPTPTQPPPPPPTCRIRVPVIGGCL